MPRVQVIADDGWVALDELVFEAQLEGDHARRCLADRILWAIRDADAHAASHGRDEGLDGAWARPSRTGDRSPTKEVLVGAPG